ncbi:MAG TPA: glycosyltransferase family 2 protein [Aromatoleum sp.]|uniref:glycosyltransferase family 2 protein n=1 Tax=Aromatoleum sp. TaxID=2307007 RepID=UPI002B48D9DF|nr:glycosyltransferase family 2 protein [Aromatoleum sp.]HJV25440.1 glycosyltransferase family 2 protein [Aromatoleum sp.]
MKILAIVVTYFPQSTTLSALLGSLVRQVDEVLIVDNTPAAEEGAWRAIVLEGRMPDRVRIVRLGKNKGIGYAINVGIDVAIAEGCSHILLSDQDSLPESGMVDGLRRAADEAGNDGKMVAAVGPVYCDEIAATEFPFQVQKRGRFGYVLQHATAACPVLKVQTLITSGCLIDLAAIERAGPMREDFFIDFVDMEWCHRARAEGMVLIGTAYARLQHHMGDQRLRVWCLGWRNWNGYGPDRLYYRSRNFMRLLVLPYVAWQWKLRACRYWGATVYAHLIFAKRRRGNFRALLSGSWDGLRGRMGPRA